MAENGPFGAPSFDPKIPPKKFMWVPFGVLSLEMRHINFFLGAQAGGVSGGGGGRKVEVEKVYVFFPSLRVASESYRGNSNH